MVNHPIDLEDFRLGALLSQLLNRCPHELGTHYFGMHATMPNWQGLATNLQRSTLALH